MAAEHAPDLPEHGVILDQEHPWPGLVSFVEQNRDYFRGRDADADEVVRLVESSLVTVIYGLAGLGKTSLLQAGVYPRLRETNWLPVPVRLDFNDETPLVDQVFEALTREIPAAPERRDNETLWEFFHRSDVVFWNERHRVARPLLVFDQFEELFTIGKDKASGRTDFIAQLTDLAAGRPSAAVIARLAADAEESARFDPSRHRYGVVLSLREDYLAELDALRALYPGIDAVRKRLTKMNGRDALAVVEAGKHLVDPATARAIVSFVATGDPDSVQRLEEMEADPALLSVVCAELNNKRFAMQPSLASIDRGLLDQNRDSILADFYAAAMKDFEGHPGVRKLVEDGLLTPHGYRASMSEDQAEAQFGVGAALITDLVNRRLVRVETRGRARRIELTHDLLTQVIRASRDRRRDIEKQIAETGREEAERREQKVRRRLRVSNLLLALVLILGAGAGFIYWKYVLAQRDAARASGRWAMRLAIDYINQDRPVDALAYLAHAMRTDRENAVARRLALDLMLSNMWYVVRAVLPHQDVHWLRFTDDGTRLLSVDGTTIVVKDLPDGEAKRFEYTNLTWVSFVPDGSRFVTASSNRVMVRETADATVLSQWEEDADVAHVFVSPNGLLVAVHAGDTVRVREIGGALRFSVPVARSQQLDVRFSPDGTRLGIANQRLNDSTLEIAAWETTRGTQLHSTTVKSYRPHDFEIDRNVTHLAIALGDGLVVEPLDSGKTPRMLSKRLASDVEFRPDGAALLAVVDGRVYVDSLEGRDPPKGLTETSTSFGNRVAYAHYTGDGLRVWTVSVNEQLQFWTPEGEPLSAPIAGGDVSAVSFDGRQVAARTGASLSLLTTPGLMQLAVPASWVDMSADEKSLFVLKENLVEVIDASSGKPRPYGKLPAGSISAPPQSNLVILEPSPEGAPQPWIIFDPDTGRRITLKELPLRKNTLYASSFSGDGKRGLFIDAAPFSAWIYDLTTGALIRTFDALPEGEKESTATALSFAGDRAAFVGSSGAVTVFDVETGKGTISERLGLVSAEFSRDGKLLVCRNAAYAWYLDAQTLRQANWPPPDGAAIPFVGLSDDTAGKYIVTASRDGSASVRLLKTMEPIGAPLRQVSTIVSSNFSADGARFATSTVARVHVVWDTQTGAQVTAPHRSVDLMVVWLGTPGRRFPIVDRSGFARVIELAESSASQAHILAELAEHLTGLRFRDGTMTPVTELLDMRESAGGGGEVARLVKAFRATDATRDLTPFTDTTVEEFVQERLDSAGADRDAVARKLAVVYPGAVKVR